MANAEYPDIPQRVKRAVDQMNLSPSLAMLWKGIFDDLTKWVTHLSRKREGDVQAGATGVYTMFGAAGSGTSSTGVSGGGGGGTGGGSGTVSTVTYQKIVAIPQESWIPDDALYPEAVTGVYQYYVDITHSLNRTGAYSPYCKNVAGFQFSPTTWQQQQSNSVLRVWIGYQPTETLTFTIHALA